jgi:hypothetical protein
MNNDLQAASNMLQVTYRESRDLFGYFTVMKDRKIILNMDRVVLFVNKFYNNVRF